MRYVCSVFALFAATFATLSCSKPTPIYQLPDRTIDDRTEDLLGRIPLDEKLDMLSGATWMDTVADTKLGIPAIHFAYGTSGVADWTMPGETSHPQFSATAFPAAIALAATWNPDLVGKVGQAVARDALGAGRNQIIGPMLDLARTPLSGTTFNAFGEDPHLTGRMAVPFIKAVQAEGAIATAGHFVLQNQEANNRTHSVRVSERALQEIYFPPMEAAVRGGVWSVMASAGRINGTWVTEDSRFLNTVLRREWDFRGYVVSEWAATHSSAGASGAGLDLEMPNPDVLVKYLKIMSSGPGGNIRFAGGFFSNDRLSPEVARGSIRPDTVDEMLRRRFRAMFATGIFDKKGANTKPNPAEQQATARAAAGESIVLLKNSGALPLNPEKVKSIAVIGPSAAVARVGAGVATLTSGTNAVTPLDGLKSRAGAQIKVEYAQGVPMEGEAGTPAIADAASLARRSDVAVVFVGTSAAMEKEDADRTSIDLPARQDELIAAVTAANRNTIVVVLAGSAVDMTSWSNAASAIAMAWLPGEQGGNAIADVLFGDVNPSGKLPLTFPRSLKDSGAAQFYPGTETDLTYGDDIFVGYRHFDKQNIAPLFPFGHGLSYTTFEISDLTVPVKAENGKNIPVTLTVKNTGARAGAEVLQLYVSDLKPKTERAPKDLRAFRKVNLKPGESSAVKFELTPRDLSWYDTTFRKWRADNGEFEVLIGTSSRDIRARAKFELAEPPPPPPPPPPIGSQAPRGAKGVDGRSLTEKGKMQPFRVAPLPEEKKKK